MKFDRVVANPPFSLDKWGQEELKEDRFGRFKYGLPPKSKADFAFVEHMLASLNSNGVMGLFYLTGCYLGVQVRGRYEKL